MRNIISVLLLSILFSSCGNEKGESSGVEVNPEADSLAQEVKNETLRSWKSYKKYAWGHDVLAPISKSYKDCYKEPLYISPIDAFSTLHLMELKDEASEIERYVVDSLNFDKDIDVKIFEVNIRILGGLLAMYEHSQNPRVLDKARDFADRMLLAFDTKTGIPKYWV
ncbi:MAG: glycoside hydrolase family 47 protein, partial [Candidatus Kapaibacterium sp.]